MQKPTNLRFLSVLAAATILSLLFMFIGSPFLRVIHNVFGRKKYWISGALICLAAYFAAPVMAIFLFSIWLCVGVYSELEKSGKAGLLAASAAIFLGTTFFMFGTHLWMGAHGVVATEFVQEMINKSLTQLQGSNMVEALKLEPKTLLQQLPSILTLMYMATLGFAVMLDRRYATMAGLRFEKIASSIKLLEFRLPDFMIWVMMISFLFSFLKLEQQMISVVALNVFNITMGFYFFQGLAVLEVLFLVLRSGPIFKFIVYFFIVGQLFFLLSAVGVIDYWADFRRRMKNKKAMTGSHNHGEQL